MYNIYERVYKKSFNGTKVVSRKRRLNNYELDAHTVDGWFKFFEKNMEATYNVRAVTRTAFTLTISYLTKDGRNMIWKYWAEATK